MPLHKDRNKAFEIYAKLGAVTNTVNYKQGNSMSTESTDVFKKVYTVMPEDIKNIIFNMKTKAEELKSFFDGVNNREMSIAQTNLEQALMWATKAYVKCGDEINAGKDNPIVSK